MSKKDLVSITKKEYDDLLKSSKLLEIMYSLGIENWEFFDDVLDAYDGVVNENMQYVEESTMGKD